MPVPAEYLLACPIEYEYRRPRQRQVYRCLEATNFWFRWSSYFNLPRSYVIWVKRDERTHIAR